MWDVCEVKWKARTIERKVRHAGEKGKKMDERRHWWNLMTRLFSIIGNSMVNGVGALSVQLKLVFNKKELSTALSETRLERETIDISSPSSRE